MNIGVTVLGAGSWGTTVAHLAASNVPTILWARDPQVVEALGEHGLELAHVGILHLSA